MFRGNSLKLPFRHVTGRTIEREFPPTSWELHRYDADGAALFDADFGCDELGLSHNARAYGSPPQTCYLFSTTMAEICWAAQQPRRPHPGNASSPTRRLGCFVELADGRVCFRRPCVDGTVAECRPARVRRGPASRAPERPGEADGESSVRRTRQVQTDQLALDTEQVANYRSR